MMLLDSSLTADELARLVKGQIDHLFPDPNPANLALLKQGVERALPRLEHCFSRLNHKYFFNGKHSVFDHLHGDQYAMWLYFLSNELYRMDEDGLGIAKKLYRLNKSLHGCDIFYEVELPEIFLLTHPLGTVLGRGHYQDYLSVYQQCGVGANYDVYPSMGKFFTLRPNSFILGNSQVGDNVTLAANALLIDKNIASNTVYFGDPKDNFTREQTDILAIWRVE